MRLKTKYLVLPSISKYITTPEFDKVAVENFTARLYQANLASKNDIADLVKKTDFDNKLKNLNKKVTLNKTKCVLDENELKKLQRFDPSLFTVQSYFNNDGAQLYLILQRLYYNLKILGDTKGLSAEKPTTPTTADNSLSPSIKWYENSNFCLIIKGSFLKHKNVIFTPAIIITFLLFLN